MARDRRGVVVVGAGHAGTQVAVSLREGGYEGPLSVIGSEPELPYQRPPLSKDLLLDDAATPMSLFPEETYAAASIELIRGRAVLAIDRAASEVVLDDGDRRPYDHLVLATGAAEREVPIVGLEHPGVHRLRTLRDAQGLRTPLQQAGSVVIVGAGFIGLEVAAVARQRGADVTVFEAGPQVLGRAASQAIAEYVDDFHVAAGVALHRDTPVVEVLPEGRHWAVRTARGTEHRADLVVVGVGVAPRDDLARRAGLPVDDGILVDAQLRSLEDPAVFAIGDCARTVAEDGTSRRLESVQNATEQARRVARVVLGQPLDEPPAPWFWSIQGSLRLQIAGLLDGAEEQVILGEPGTGRFSVCSFRHGELVCVESVNRPADHVAARRLLAEGEGITKAEVAAPSFALKARVRAGA